MSKTLDTRLSKIDLITYIKNSIFNAFLVYRLLIKQFFVTNIFDVVKISRYEYWCFVFVFGAVSILLYYIINSLIIYTDFDDIILRGIFLIYLTIFIPILSKCFVGRMKSSYKYIEYYSANMLDTSFINKIERLIFRIIFQVKNVWILLFINYIIIISTVFYYFYHTVFNLSYMEAVYNNVYVTYILFFFVCFNIFCLIVSMFFSVYRFEFLTHYNIETYSVYNGQPTLSSDKYVEFFLFVSGVFYILVIAHIFIVGLSLTLVMFIMAATVSLSLSLFISKRFFVVLMGILGFLISLKSNISVFPSDINLFVDFSKQLEDNMNIYKLAISALFLGVMYYTLDNNRVKLTLVVICIFLSMIFLVENMTAFKGLLLYDIYTYSQIVYAFLVLSSFSAYVIVILYRKTKTMNKDILKTTFQSEDRPKRILVVAQRDAYLIVFLSSIFILIANIILEIYPLLGIDNLYIHLNKDFDGVIRHIERILICFLILGFFVILKVNRAYFSLCLLFVMAVLELYVVLLPSLPDLFPLVEVYNQIYAFTMLYLLYILIFFTMYRYCKLVAVGMLLWGILFFNMSFSLLHIEVFNESVKDFLFFLFHVLGLLFMIIGAFLKLKEWD